MEKINQNLNHKNKTNIITRESNNYLPGSAIKGSSSDSNKEFNINSANTEKNGLSKNSDANGNNLDIRSNSRSGNYSTAVIRSNKNAENPKRSLHVKNKSESAAFNNNLNLYFELENNSKYISLKEDEPRGEGKNINTNNPKNTNNINNHKNNNNFNNVNIVFKHNTPMLGLEKKKNIISSMINSRSNLFSGDNISENDFYKNNKNKSHLLHNNGQSNENSKVNINSLGISNSNPIENSKGFSSANANGDEFCKYELKFEIKKNELHLPNLYPSESEFKKNNKKTIINYKKISSNSITPNKNKAISQNILNQDNFNISYNEKIKRFQYPSSTQIIQNRVNIFTLQFFMNFNIVGNLIIYMIVKFFCLYLA